GEVFVTENQTVLKVIPVEGSVEIAGEAQKKFEEVLPEIVISQCLSKLREHKEHYCKGFVEVSAVKCVRGSYPTYMKTLWDEYDQEIGSENENPNIFGDEQTYIVFELENAGKDLECFTFLNSFQSVSIFIQFLNKKK
uniref:Uncharacterized protein n=1 Tax=Megaselia scalaris TaxID=36166 RepID=T1H443_MEGSC